MELERPIEEAPQDRFQYAVIVLILLVTIWGTIVALLQSNASARENQAARESVARAIQLMAEMQRNSQQSSYDLGVLAEITALSMDNIARRATALELEQAGQSQEATVYQREAEILAAQAQALRLFTAFYSDPRYAPQGDSLVPNTEAYLLDWQTHLQALLEQQNAASDETNRWGQKADAYTSIITILAVVLFLFGLSLIIRSRVRYLFTAAGVLIGATTVLWAAVTILML
ncbi:MAG: hypothetical protein JW900_04160 [Anaerolineae bacterium]|nr:hypothetical protein [Anaerolineae bacterium]